MPGNASGTVTTLQGGSPVETAQVSLYNDTNEDGLPDGPPVDTTFTNVNGEYSFTGHPVGDYVIVLEPEYDSTIDGGVFDQDTSDDGDDVTNAAVGDRMIPVSLTPLEDDVDNNFTIACDNTPAYTNVQCFAGGPNDPGTFDIQINMFFEGVRAGNSGTVQITSDLGTAWTDTAQAFNVADYGQAYTGTVTGIPDGTTQITLNSTNVIDGGCLDDIVIDLTGIVPCP